MILTGLVWILLICKIVFLSKWAKLSGAKPEQCFAIYNGDKDIKTSTGEVLYFKKIDFFSASANLAILQSTVGN